MIRTTYIFGFCVVVYAEQALILHLWLPENQNRQSQNKDQQPLSHKDRQDDLAPGERMDTMGPPHSHKPVEAHQHYQHDGGVHVGVAQVEQQLAHHSAEHPALLGHVDQEKHGEAHDGAVGAGQVQDQQGGDGALPSAGQDAPDDEEVPWDTQEEDYYKDDGADDEGNVPLAIGNICAIC